MKVSRRALLPMLLAPVAAAKAKLLPVSPTSEEPAREPPFSTMGEVVKMEELLSFKIGDVVAVSLTANGDVKVVKSNSLVSTEHCLFTAYARFVELTTDKDAWRKYEVTGIEGELATCRQRCYTKELRRIPDPFGAYTAIHVVTEVWDFISELRVIRGPTVTDETVDPTVAIEPVWGSGRLDDFQLRLRSLDDFQPKQTCYDTVGLPQKKEEVTQVFDVPLVAKRPIDEEQIKRICNNLLK